MELAALAGLELDPWQQFVLEHSLGERGDGRHLTPEVGLVVPRQNGKGSILEARELAGLFILGEELLIHTAHEFATSLEAFKRLKRVIKRTPELLAKVDRFVNSHGEEGIDLVTGQEIRFRTRTKGGGRGFSADCVILDEAMILPTATMAALRFTLSARPNWQLWFTGSAVNQEIHEHGVEFARLRERGHEGQEGLAFFEWSADEDADAADPRSWAQANPGLGIRITTETVAGEHRAMDGKTFDVERLGKGDWPKLNADGGDGIDPDAWDACEDRESVVVDDGPVVFSLDVSPKRSRATITLAGRREDGLPHLEVVDHRAGTNGVVERLVDLTEAHDCGPVQIAARSPAASLIEALRDAGVKVDEVSTAEHAEACGLIFDAVEDRELRHGPCPLLGSAVRAGVRKDAGGGETWLWSRKRSSADITALVSATLALRALRAFKGGSFVFDFSDEELEAAWS